MFHALLLIAAATATAQNQEPPVQSKNGEFIFRNYPPRAKAAGEQGSVRFQAEADAKGNVLKCKVTESSGYKLLDEETCIMIVDHATFKPTLDSKGRAREAIHDGIVNWRITGTASLPQPQLASANLPDEIICKRIPRTGSLVAHARLCKTARAWNRSADDIQEEWGALQGRFGSTRGPEGSE